MLTAIRGIDELAVGIPGLILLGLGVEPHRLTNAQVRRIVGDIDHAVDHAVDLVELTILEFIPREVMNLQQILKGLPLIAGERYDALHLSR